MGAGFVIALAMLGVVVAVVTLFPHDAPMWAVWTAFAACIATVGTALAMLLFVGWEALA